MDACLNVAGGIADLFGGHADDDEFGPLARDGTTKGGEGRNENALIRRNQAHRAAGARFDEIGHFAVGEHHATADDHEFVGEDGHLLQQMT